MAVGCMGVWAEIGAVGADGAGNAGVSDDFVQHFLHTAKMSKLMISTILIIAVGEENSQSNDWKALSKSSNSLSSSLASNSPDI